MGRIYIEGYRINSWTVLEKADKRRYLVLCDCGETRIHYGSNLKRMKSCGHERRHGMSGTRFYNIWAGMKDRCSREKHINYNRYGGRGIKVCERWLKFENFRDDMYKKYSETSKNLPKCEIDRIDNEGNYEPSNCRWISHKRNNDNRDNRNKHRKFTSKQVELIRGMSKSGKSHSSIAKEVGGSRREIGKIVNHKIYKDIK